MDFQPLFQAYQTELNSFFDRIDKKQVAELLEAIKACKGLVVFSGIGKSGIVAQKIAMTMTSTGTRAIFISPVEAMHGDIGVITQGDLFIALSKSGETDELLQLIPSVRNKGAKIAAVVSNEKSRIALASDIVLKIPVQKELCPFNLAPTISTTSQLILGDILAIALMQQQSFSIDQYALNHPSGSIGKQITVRVEDLMIKDAGLPVAYPHDRIIDVLQVLTEKRAGCLLVIDEEKKLQGIFTDGDLRRALQSHGEKLFQMKLEDLMTAGGRTIGPKALVWEAMKVMEANQKHPIMVLPVVDEARQVLGLLKMHDIIQSGI
ncbi:MAG: SIS domain-containing protein [Parachlamydiaceae bacterium]